MLSPHQPCPHKYVIQNVGACSTCHISPCFAYLLLQQPQGLHQKFAVIGIFRSLYAGRFCQGYFAPIMCSFQMLIVFSTHVTYCFCSPVGGRVTLRRCIWVITSFWGTTPPGYVTCLQILCALTKLAHCTAVSIISTASAQRSAAQRSAAQRSTEGQQTRQVTAIMACPFTQWP